jgi:hypothetical protein
MTEAAAWAFRYADNIVYFARCLAVWQRDYGGEFVECVRREVAKMQRKQKGAKRETAN